MFFVLGALLVLALHFLIPAIGLGSFSWRAVRPAVSASALPPWGQLECTPLHLERPDESLPTNAPPPQAVEWFFDGVSEIQLEALIKADELSPAQQEALLDKSRWKAEAGGWVILPPPDTVRELVPKARKHLYAALRKSPRNIFHYYPFRFEAGRFEAWLADSGLPGDKQELFRKLTYAEGDSIFFSDTQLIEMACTPEENRRLAKAISQTPALLVKLQVRPDSDIDALARYWGRAGRGRMMKPLLESLAKAPDNPAISVSYFFPAFARTRLYTYPDPAANPNQMREDCFWTAMNFFNELPDNRFFNPEYTKQVLRAEYSVVKTNWRFGDLMLLLGENNLAVHMCVYIADDVVFTKNGYYYLQPWVLMRRHDMQAQFPTDKPFQWIGYRRKG